MPFFLGAIYNNIEPQRLSKLNQRCFNIIQDSTNRDITNIKSDFWLISASLKNYETPQENLITFPNDDGLGIGRFYNKNSTNCSSITKDYKKISSTQGKLLAETYWGRHVVIIANKVNKSLTIFRDAVGLSQMYFVKCHNIVFFSSDIYFLRKIMQEEGYTLDIDWEYFTSFLSCGPLHTSKTPILEVNELLPGCFLTYNDDEISMTPYWDPTTLPFEKKINEKSIISVFNNCVKNWVKNSPGICLQISGGLDSSALFLSIKNSIQKHQPFELVTFFHSLVASSDESKYVKELIKDSNLDLIMHEQDFNPVLHRTAEWNRPHPDILKMNGKASLINSLSSKHPQLVCGHGGDQLFLSKARASYLTDYLLDIGFGGLGNKIMNAALMNRVPALPYINDIIKDLYRSAFRGNVKKAAVFPILMKDWFTKEFQELLNPEIYLPPFWRNLSKVNPGKAFHILQTYHASAGIEQEYAGITEVYPFLSQPLVELALTIPTYETFDAQWTRLPFRKAISNHFKTNLVWRQSKGEISGVMQLCVSKNMKKVEELCLEGRFAQQKLIHKDLLRKHIHLLANGQVEEQWLIIRLLSSELWLSNFSNNINSLGEEQ